MTTTIFGVEHSSPQRVVITYLQIYLKSFYRKKKSFISYHKKNGSQHARKALIIIPNVLAAFRSLLIFELQIGSNCALCLETGIPFIWRCLSRSNAATFDLKVKVVSILYIFRSRTMFLYFSKCKYIIVEEQRTMHD